MIGAVAAYSGGALVAAGLAFLARDGTRRDACAAASAIAVAGLISSLGLVVWRQASVLELQAAIVVLVVDIFVLECVRLNSVGCVEEDSWARRLGRAFTVVAFALSAAAAIILLGLEVELTRYSIETSADKVITREVYIPHVVTIGRYREVSGYCLSAATGGGAMSVLLLAIDASRRRVRDWGRLA